MVSQANQQDSFRVFGDDNDDDDVMMKTDGLDSLRVLDDNMMMMMMLMVKTYGLDSLRVLHDNDDDDVSNHFNFINDL